MRGTSQAQHAIFTVVTPAQVVPVDHPIRKIKELADRELALLSGVFDQMYSDTGRPSIPPEALLKSCLLIALFSVRSERQFCEQLGYNLLFRWFLDQTLNDEPFDHTVFAKNKERMLKSEVAQKFFDGIVRQAKEAHLLSAEHFTVDGTLIESWASLKSFVPKNGPKKKDPPGSDPGNPTVDFHGEKRSNETHHSTTDPEAMLARKGKGKEAKLSFSTNVLMENRNGLLVDIRVEKADGYAERRAVLEMIPRADERGIKVRTLGADKAFDERLFVRVLRMIGITPHVAGKETTILDGRTTRHAGYALSQRVRKRVEEIFGWMKTVGGFRKTRYRGTERTGLWAYMVGSAYNLLRMAKLRTV
jgi:transposase